MIIQIIAIVLGILVAIFAFKFLKSIIKAAFIGIFLILLLFGLGVLVAYMDIEKIKTNNTYITITDNNQTVLMLRVAKPDLSNFISTEVPNVTKNINQLKIPLQHIKKVIPKNISFNEFNFKKEELIQGIKEGNKITGTAGLV